MKIKTQDRNAFKPVSIELVFETRKELETMLYSLNPTVGDKLEDCQVAWKAMESIADTILAVLEDLDS